MSFEHSGRSSEPDITTGVSGARLRPGWTELVVGIVGLLVLAFGLPPLVTSFQPDAVTFGLFMTALSAIVAGGGFAIAAVVRIRSWGAFGVRGTTARWLLIGLGGGLAAFVLGRAVGVLYVVVSGDTSDPQQSFAQGAAGGTLPLVLAFLLLAVATPIGEELLFRGVVATALLRYGAVVGVVGSALIFAALHGLNGVVAPALVVGLITAELRRRSGSVWPGVVVHITHNCLTSAVAFILVPALAG